MGDIIEFKRKDYIPTKLAKKLANAFIPNYKRIGIKPLLVHHKQNSISMGNLPDRWHRRMLRSTIHARDPGKLRNLVDKGINVNMVISDVLQDTPLTYAVKIGYLEMVEALVSMAECDIDQTNRNKHSPLDEAICAWLLCASTEGRSAIGNRYRILRCLLAEGAKHITVTFLDMLIFSALNVKYGRDLIGKLAKVVCDKGHENVKSNLLGVLIPYNNTTPFIWMLLKYYAVPETYVFKEPARPFMPLDNAILLIKATNHSRLLSRIDCDTSSQLEATKRDWVKYKLVLKLLTLSGHQVQSHVMVHLYQHHADIYSWIVKYQQNSPPLSHLTRIVIRRNLAPNVMVALATTRRVPHNLKQFLIFNNV